MSRGLSRSKLAKTVFPFFLETPIPKIFPVPIQAQEHTHWVIQSALASSELLFAILAMSAASLLALTKNFRTTFANLTDTEDRHGLISAHDAVAFKVVAVELLRSAIENNPEPDWDILLYSITCLMVTEIIKEDINAIKVHLDALRKLIQSRGGYENLPGHVIETLVSSSYIASTITGDRPIPPPLCGATMAKVEGRAASTPISNANPDLKQLGQGFLDPEMEAILGPQLVSIFRDMSIFILWGENYRLSSTDPGIARMDFFNCLRWRSHFSALNLPFEKQHAPNNMQAPCRIALLIFWNANTQVNQPGSLLYRTLAAQLRNALGKLVLYSSWERFQGLLAWVLLLGAFITEGEPECRWFAMNITSLLQNTGMTPWHEMEPILRRFLYLERTFQTGFERIWNKAIDFLTDST